MTVPIDVTINGDKVSVEVCSRLLLCDLLRDTLGLTGTHVGCEHGVCGACTILLDGEAARSCLMFAVQADGAVIETIEGLHESGVIADLQAAFSRHHALQCGFCTPGMLIIAHDLLLQSTDLSAPQIRDGMSASLCRCTGYAGIVAAVQDVARSRAAGLPR
jgi:carbon-monoxide dehydrogenase small subunit